MNLITINALCAADYLVLPVCCDMFAIDSMKTLLDNLLELKEKHLSKCNLLGILRTIYDPMQPLASRISHELAESFKDLLFATKISYNPKISESSSAACPVLVYDRTSLGSREYLSFAGEILKSYVSCNRLTAKSCQKNLLHFSNSLIFKKNVFMAYILLSENYNFWREELCQSRYKQILPQSRHRLI